MATSAQIESAFTIQNVFNILNTSAPINKSIWIDVTDWAALGISSGAGDTVKTIFQTIDPVGQYPYQNAGYQTDNYGSPNTTLASLTTAVYSLFAYSGTTTPIWGTYQVMVKVQVVLASDPGNPIYIQKTFSIELAEGLAPTLSLELTDSCTQLTFTSTDTSSYGVANYTLTSNVRTHTVYPPAVAGQSNVTANAAIVVLGSPSNPLWTNATYEASLSVELTYTRGGHSFITHGSTTGERRVVCTNDLCSLKCCLETLETGYNQYKAAQNFVLAADYQQKFILCTGYYNLIQAYLLCGDTDSVAAATTSFYNTAKPYCTQGCGCSDCDDEPALATASNILQGPTGATGPQGPIGATGATGATGAEGPAGAVILYNNYSNATSANTGSYQTLDTFDMDAAQLGTNGDMIHIHAVFTVIVGLTSPDEDLVRIQLGGNNLIEKSFTEFSGSVLAIDIYLSRTGATASSYEYVSVFSDGLNPLNQTQIEPASFSSTTWANAQTIRAQVNQVAANAVRLKVLRTTYYHQS